MNEPNIIVNGVTLTLAQSMTVRVALQAFATSLRDDGLGDDETGKQMVQGYLAAIRDINRLISN